MYLLNMGHSRKVLTSGEFAFSFHCPIIGQKINISRYKYALYSTVYPESSTGSTYRFNFQTAFGNVTQSLKNIMFMATVKLTKKNGAVLPPNSEICPANNLLYNLVKSLRVYINNQMVMVIPCVLDSFDICFLSLDCKFTTLSNLRLFEHQTRSQ